MNVKSFFFLLALSAISLTLTAQEGDKTSNAKKDSGYVFTTVKELPITPIKDQARAGTCWSYSAIGFLESELLRMGKGEYDLSEMFVAYNTYIDRARAAVRTHGDISFAQGGSFADVLYCMQHYGLVPESEMRPGVMYGDTLSKHDELSAVSEAVVKAIAKGDQKSLQHNTNNEMLWEKAIRAIHDVYLGKCPETFVYDGTTFTPVTFYQSLGLNADDYVSITSYTHHPFYEKFILEIQDNWRWSQCYNVPLDEFMQIFDNAIENGYTIAWGADVSEDGFRKCVKKGYCILPDLETGSTDNGGSDMAHWSGLNKEERAKEAYDHPTKQRWVSQEERQIAYDNWETTDDHGMLIYGKATDQMGNEYYMVKNSWGKVYEYKGMFYASKAFVRYKTMNIVVHKDALPKEIKKKLGIK